MARAGKKWVSLKSQLERPEDLAACNSCSCAGVAEAATVDEQQEQKSRTTDAERETEQEMPVRTSCSSIPSLTSYPVLAPAAGDRVVEWCR